MDINLCELKIKNKYIKTLKSNVGKVNKDFILKKENILFNLENTFEYQFYLKNIDKIKKYNFNYNIQIPIKYQICNEKRKVYYLFSRLKGDIDKDFLVKLSKNEVINIFQQSLISIYFINHKLHFYHNDFLSLSKGFSLNNLMYMKNDKKIKLTTDNLKVTVGKYRTIIIDFGMALRFPRPKTLSFFVYFNFKYISEVFLLFVVLYFTYKNRYVDIELIRKMYNFFESKMDQKGVKAFDKSVFNHFSTFLL